MICPSCHAENIEGADECVNCGQALYGLDVPGSPRGGQAPQFVQDPIVALPKHEAPTIGVSDPVGLAVSVMQRRDVGCVLVMDGERLAGIITGWAPPPPPRPGDSPPAFTAVGDVSRHISPPLVGRDSVALSAAKGLSDAITQR